MKWNCYDLLDYYNTEKNDMPALKTQPIQTDAVLERVQARPAAFLPNRRENFTGQDGWPGQLLRLSW